MRMRNRLFSHVLLDKLEERFIPSSNLTGSIDRSPPGTLGFFFDKVDVDLFYDLSGDLYLSMKTSRRTG